jgi:hypothetical protein
MLVPALRVKMAVQTRHYSRTVLGTDTMLVEPDRAWTVLFRVVPRPAHRVSANWPSIDRVTEGRHTWAWAAVDEENWRHGQ